MNMAEENISKKANEIALSLLPDKSSDKYLRAYDNFMSWKRKQNTEEFLVYFNNLNQKYAPTTLWCEYSMLRTTMLRNNNIDINYPKLNAFLKKCSVGFHSKKSKTFRAEEIRQFLTEANDIEFLAVKVIMIFGIYGATRGDELTKVDVKDVREEGRVLIIKIPETKTKIIRSFTLEDQYAEFVQKYKSHHVPKTPCKLSGREMHNAANWKK